MPFLADIDAPPRSRVPGMIWGLIAASPVVVVIVAWFIPSLVRAVLGGAEGIDQRLRLENEYMSAVCTQALDLPRDEALCTCALATEFPSLDCQGRFQAWSVARQVEHCSDDEARKEALSFCTCVGAVAEAMQQAPTEERGAEAQAYRNCQALADAVYLPTIEQLSASQP